MMEQLTLRLAAIYGAASAKTMRYDNPSTRRASPDVVVYRDISFAIRDFLVQNGIVPASNIGARDDMTRPTDYIGLLIPSTKKVRFGNPRARFVGVLWLSNSTGLQQFQGRDWWLRIYGIANMKSLTDLAALLSAEFGKSITVTISNTREEEEYRSGNGW